MKMEFCEKLIRLRKTRHMTQDDLAQALRVSRQAVYKWECGQSYPEALKLVAMKELFGISIDNLLDPAFEVEMPSRTRKRRGDEALEQIKAESKSSEETHDAVEEPKVLPEETSLSKAKTEEKEQNTPLSPTVESTPVPQPIVSSAAETSAEEQEKTEKKGFFSRLFGRK